MLASTCYWAHINVGERMYVRMDTQPQQLLLLPRHMRTQDAIHLQCSHSNDRAHASIDVYAWAHSLSKAWAPAATCIHVASLAASL